MKGIALHYTGASNEHLVISYLTSQGFDVFTPVLMHSRCDFIYLRDGKPVRAQVKTSSKSPAGAFSYEQCRLVGDRRGGGDGHTYTKEEIDEVWVVGTHLWRLPIADVEGRTSLFLNSDNPEPRVTRRTYDRLCGCLGHLGPSFQRSPEFSGRARCSRLHQKRSPCDDRMFDIVGLICYPSINGEFEMQSPSPSQGTGLVALVTVIWFVLGTLLWLFGVLTIHYLWIVGPLAYIAHLMLVGGMMRKIMEVEFEKLVDELTDMDGEIAVSTFHDATHLEGSLN